jgi:Right handed beta helix region
MMEPLIFHISPEGHDTWSGGHAEPLPGGTDGPWATLSGARDGLRKLRALPEFQGQPVTVVIRDGFFELPETLRFDPQDSGLPDAPVRYVAAAGAAPVISAGRRITGWIETEHNGKRCWVAELPEVAAGGWTFNRLYVNQSARPRPQLPKEGFYHFTGVDGLPDSGFKWHHGPDRANYAPGEIKNWHNLEDVELVTYQLWFETRHRIRAIEEEKCLVHFHAPSMGSLRDERGEFARYFVRNVFEALDEPGEWYLDRKAGKLYYLPFDHESLASTVVIAPRLREILRLEGKGLERNGAKLSGDRDAAHSGQCPSFFKTQGGADACPGLLDVAPSGLNLAPFGTERVSHLHFENLTFAHQQWEMPRDCTGYIQAAFGVPGAIILEGAEACVFYGCQITHVSGYGLEILAGSTGNTVAACTISDTGAGGIKIGHEELAVHESAVGDRFQPEPPVPPIATTVMDCHIRDCGHLFPSAIGIWVGNSGWNRLLHNSISYCNYTGISCGWTWGYAPTRTVANRIENNHIHHINHREVLSDNGGIYTLGQQPGTVLRGNVIHDISCYGYGAWGIYPDEGSSEMRIEHNLVCGTKKAAVSSHYGRDNLIQQNLFALSESDHIGLGKRECHRSAVYRHNILLPLNGRFAGNWNPAHFTAENNLVHALDGGEPTFGGFTLSDLEALGQGRGTVVADPLCSDAEGRDFSLRTDSPALAMGFKPWNWKTAGARGQGRRPADYQSYLKKHPLPPPEVPVLRTRIEPLDSPEQAFASGSAEFEIIISNIGRAPASGTLRLAAGPKRAVRQPGLKQIEFSLSPGEERREKVGFKIRKPCDCVWLETRPAGEITVPARKLLFAPSVFEWAVPIVGDPDGLGEIGAALRDAPVRTIRHGSRKVAAVKLACSETGLILHADFFQPALKPKPEQPWTGTGLELVAYAKAAEGKPHYEMPACQQVFLIPHETGIEARKLEGSGTVPSPPVKSCSRPIRGGWEISAHIPWSEFGLEEKPGELLFDLIVDALDPESGATIQVSSFDLPADGWRRLFGRLVCGK